jgi:hypothetical protein
MKQLLAIIAASLTISAFAVDAAKTTVAPATQTAPATKPEGEMKLAKKKDHTKEVNKSPNKDAKTSTKTQSKPATK